MVKKLQVPSILLAFSSFIIKLKDTYIQTFFLFIKIIKKALQLSTQCLKRALSPSD